jgi:hypothetical protein
LYVKTDLHGAFLRKRSLFQRAPSSLFSLPGFNLLLPHHLLQRLSVRARTHLRHLCVRRIGGGGCCRRCILLALLDELFGCHSLLGLLLPLKFLLAHALLPFLLELLLLLHHLQVVLPLCLCLLLLPHLLLPHCLLLPLQLQLSFLLHRHRGRQLSAASTSPRPPRTHSNTHLTHVLAPLL